MTASFRRIALASLLLFAALAPAAGAATTAAYDPGTKVVTVTNDGDGETEGDKASDAPDTITGTAANNVITTGSGNDSVDGGGGSDVIDTGTGDDLVNAIDGVTDIVACGAGADNVGADLAGTNGGRADALTGCGNVSSSGARASRSRPSSP